MLTIICHVNSSYYVIYFWSQGDDDDEGIADSKDIFENVVDNDAGEDILLQKLAEESEQEQNQQQDQDENEEEGSSSRKYQMNKRYLVNYSFDEENGITICMKINCFIF